MTRTLKPDESAIIERLLQDPFPGRDELRAQISRSRVKPVEEYGDQYGSLEFEVEGGPKAKVTQRVPVDARANDRDGVPIEFLLHVVDGVVRELEIYKADGSPIMKRPAASDLDVFIYPWKRAGRQNDSDKRPASG
jgi:Domain of unknown function (DUF6984)